MGPERAVTVVLPTRAQRARAAVLRRAIDSVLAQERVSPVPLIIINGSIYDAELVATLRGDERLRVLVSEDEGLPAALHTGRRAIDTPWFCDLDDDDLLLPGALALRLDALRDRPDCCAVITNGYWRNGSRDVLNAPPELRVAADPLRAMLRQNWFLAGSYLCRTADVGPEVFRDMPRYFERTYLASARNRRPDPVARSANRRLPRQHARLRVRLLSVGPGPPRRAAPDSGVALAGRCTRGSEGSHRASLPCCV